MPGRSSAEWGEGHVDSGALAFNGVELGTLDVPAGTEAMPIALRFRVEEFKSALLAHRLPHYAP